MTEEGDNIAVMKQHDEEEGTHMEVLPISVLGLPGSPVVCLVCDRTIKDPHGRDIHNLFLESSVTSHSQQPLSTILADVLKAPLDAEEVYSKTLCVRCMKLVDELDDLQCRSDAIKSALFGRYNRSFIKRLKLPAPDASLGGIGLDNEDEEVEIEVDDRLVARLCVKEEHKLDDDDDDDDDDEDDTLRPEDQGILPDDPEFNPARDDSVWLGARPRTRGRPRGRGRGRGRGRPRGRGRGRGRGPGRPPKVPRDSERTTHSSESIGEKLGQLVTKILGEDEEEQTVEAKTANPECVDEGVVEAEGEESTDNDTSPKEELMDTDNHQCKLCEFSTTSANQLSTHILSHAHHTCPKCGLALVRSSALHHHMKIVHGIERNIEKTAKEKYKCKICDKVYASAGALHSHTIGTHSGQMYPCGVCGRKFNHPKNLASHAIRHKERGIKCPECGAGFYLRSDLHKHINQVHRKCRPYVCEDCGRSFCQRSVLKHHRTVHSDHRPLTCPLCGRTFKHRQSFNHHLEQERKLASSTTGALKCKQATITQSESLAQTSVATQTQVKAQSCIRVQKGNITKPKLMRSEEGIQSDKISLEVPVSSEPSCSLGFSDHLASPGILSEFNVSVSQETQTYTNLKLFTESTCDDDLDLTEPCVDSHIRLVQDFSEEPTELTTLIFNNQTEEAKGNQEMERMDMNVSTNPPSVLFGNTDSVHTQITTPLGNVEGSRVPCETYIMEGEERYGGVETSTQRTRKHTITKASPLKVSQQQLLNTESIELMEDCVKPHTKTGRSAARIDEQTVKCKKSLMLTGEFVSKSLKASHKKRIHLCNVCDVEFEYVQEFREHMKTHGSYECTVCGKVISKQGMLTQHYVKFHGLKPDGDSQHICWVCGKVYKSKQAVSYHMTTSHNETKLKCDVCGKCFGHSKNLKAHKKRHGEKDITCDKCPAKFYTTSELGYHYNAKHQNAQCWKCEQCGRKFSRSTSYSNHVEKHRPKRFECTVCFKMFRRKAHIEAHMKQHTLVSNSESNQTPGSRIKEYLRCSKCSILFESEEMKKDHLCSDHMRLIKQFFCNGCNVSFHSREDLNSHSCPHRSSEAEAHPENLTEDVQLYTEQENLNSGTIAINTEEWDTCFSLEVTRPRQPGKRVPVLSEKMRLSLAKLSKRSRALPPSEAGDKEPKKLISEQEGKDEPRVKRQYRKRPYIIHLCKFCMKVCPTGEQLKEHQRTHDNIECQFCGKVLARIGAWESHLKIFHNVEIQVPGREDALTRPKDDVDCEVCGKQFASKSALAYHLKLHDNKNYQCDKCSKIFKHPSNLRTHQLRHESKNYVCVKCDKKFHTNFALLMHDNQSHRMAKSWKCKYCSKAFTRCAAFKDHLRIHTGEKPYECQMCGVKFRKIHHLKKHTKQHELKLTPNGVFKCQDCPNAVFLHKVSYIRHRKAKHSKIEVSLLTSDSDLFGSDLALKRDYMIGAGGDDDQVDTGYLDLVEVEGIEMVGLDDSSSVSLGGQRGQCIIVLSETTEEETKIQSTLPEKVAVSSSTEEGNIGLQFFKQEESENDKLTQVPVLAEAQLASLQEHIQLSEEVAAEHLQQQLSTMTTLEGGKFQVQMDGETFEVYTTSDCQLQQQFINKVFPCPYCTYTTAHPQTLVTHKSAAHRDLDCPHCGRLLATWWAYERHQRTFHPALIPEHVEQQRKALQAALQPPLVPGQKRRGRKRKVQKCETCGLVFKSRPALTYHTATKHSNTMYMCDQCSAVFPHRALLASHSLRHGERRVMCHRCGRKFFTHKQLNSHENLFHRRARSYSCELCGQSFSTLRVLRHHMRTQPHHKFYCQECGVSFIQKQQYHTHMLTHRLRCTHCNQTFASAISAHQHYRKTHANQELNQEPIIDPNTNIHQSTPDSQHIKSENDIHFTQSCHISSDHVPLTDSHNTHLVNSDTRQETHPNDKDLSEWVSVGSKVVEQQCQQKNGEENSVVIIVTSEGSEEITHYTQETQETLHHVIEEDGTVLNVFSVEKQ
ncbi:hypothetical protein Pmani_014944 [Petrolisthes manimaculis]|uniref:C2H2-type domain-containing protein n=1 Tax=Petrolisthes manimaculis TaxID=1843537 RepID=A0AAE1PT81_9EUCA|nr:hypothetical protein Pmani_014944 [Petrolisthes manimaculis]